MDKRAATVQPQSAPPNAGTEHPSPMTCFQRANWPSTPTLKPLSRCQGIGPFLQHAGRDRQKIEQAVIAKLEQGPGHWTATESGAGFFVGHGTSAGSTQT